MINDYIDGRLIIASMHDEFNIISRDWENRAPRWIHNALQTLKISLNMGTKIEDIKFDDYTFKLPCNIEFLRDIFIDNKRLEQTRVTGHHITHDQLEDTNVVETKYYTIDDGLVTTEIKSGVAQVVYTKLLLDWNERLSMYIPKVPNVPEVIENVKWYVLKVILARGYIHPVYSLTSGNKFNNPDYRWMQTIKPAKNAARRLTKQKREEMAQVMSEFIAAEDPIVDELINEKYRGDINYKI